MNTGIRSLLFFVLLISLMVFAYFLAFKPLQGARESVHRDTKLKQEKLAALRHATSEVKNLPEEIDKLRKAVNFFESRLPEEKEMDKILREVWQLAEKNGLNVKSVRSLTAIPSNDYSQQPIRMVIVGPFNGFYNFLRAVEQLPRITRINEMVLAKDQKVEGQMSADFALTIFFERGRKTPQAQAADDLASTLAKVE